MLRPAFVVAIIHTDREEGRSVTTGVDLVCSEKGMELLLENAVSDTKDGGIVLDWIIRNQCSWCGYEDSPGVRLRKDICLKPGTFQERLAMRIVTHYLEKRSFCGYIYGRVVQKFRGICNYGRIVSFPKGGTCRKIQKT